MKKHTTDAVLPSWCAILKKDKAHAMLNVFRVMAGIAGILRAGSII
ncbi:MAG TPA: hypothetical protein VIH66_01295 [Gammaproteobacteria bacterium]